MKQFKGTKGEWKHNPDSHNIVEEQLYSIGCVDAIEEDGGNHICTVWGDIENSEEAPYNAKLIAAAPELLEALQKCIDFLDNIEDDPNYGNMNDYHNARHFAKEAINKAL